MDPVFSAAEKLINDAGSDVIVQCAKYSIRRTLSMFSRAVGKTRPVTVFYDSGCSHVIFKVGIQKELDSVVVSISIAENVTVEVHDEIAVTIRRLQTNHGWCDV